MRIIERKDAKYLLFGILEISEKKRENHSNSEKKHFERKEASQMCLASFHIKRDTEKSISANLGIFLPRQCPCSRTTVLKNTRRQRFLFLFGTHEWDSKDERHRATVRWTVVTASDQAPAGARVESRRGRQKKALLRKCFFQRNPPFGWVKYCFAM